MKAKKIIDSLGMVDLILVERASKPHPVKFSMKAKWIAAVAAMLALSFVIGIWGGISFFGNQQGTESTPPFIPLGSSPETTEGATPEESLQEITPDVTTSEETPEESINADVTVEATVGEPESSSPETEPDNSAEILDLFREKSLNKNIYYMWYYGEIEQGHVAVVLTKPQIEGEDIGWTWTMGGKDFECYGNYIKVYVLVDESFVCELSSAEKEGYITKDEIAKVHVYWNENLDEFKETLKLNNMMPQITDIEPPVEITPEEAMRLAKEAYLSDSANKYSVYEARYYGKISLGHIVIVMHELVPDHIGYISLHGYRFLNYGLYVDFYYVANANGGEAMDILTAKNENKVAIADIIALYEYWQNNEEAIINDVREYINSQSTTPETTTTINPEVTPDITQESLPENLEDLIPEDFEIGADMNVLAGTLYNDEWLNVNNGDIVGMELYNRVLRVESNLSIELSVDMVKGTDQTSFQQEVRKRVGSADPILKADLISGYGMYMAALSLEGNFQNIAASENVNFSNPWWPKSLENIFVDGKVYVVTGDVAPTYTYETYAIIYNTNLISEFGLEDPVDLVKSYQWTFDKLISMTSGIYSDLNDNNIVDIGDLTAFNFPDNACLKSFPFAMGIRVVESSPEEGYVLSESYLGNNMNIIYNKFKNWYRENYGVTVNSELNDFGENFKNGTNIFTVGYFGFMKNYMSEYGVPYFFVPCPMFDTAQGKYYSSIGNPTSFFSIPTNVNLDNSALLLERLGADAYVYITPKIFERVTKFSYKYNVNDIPSQMFDIIRDGVVIDAVQLYNQNLSEGYTQFLQLLYSDSNWGSWMTRVTIMKMENDITNIADTIKALP